MKIAEIPIYRVSEKKNLKEHNDSLPKKEDFDERDHSYVERLSTILDSNFYPWDPNDRIGYLNQQKNNNWHQFIVDHRRSVPTLIEILNQLAASPNSRHIYLDST